MFRDFAGVWTAVAPARELGRRPLGQRIAGQDVVLFRDAQGNARALVDRCPHRGVKLSLGEVTSDGCVRCPFHAWEFNGAGQATHIPLNPDAKLETLSAVALPVREVGEVLWLHTAPLLPGVEPPPLQLPNTLTSPTLARAIFSVEWKTHWTRAMENMLDSPHVPFVHASTIGRFVRPRLKRESRMDVSWEETATGAVLRSSLDGQPEAGWLEFYRPNMMVLHIPIPGRVFTMHSICVPIDASRTRMIIVGARDFLRARGLNPLFNWSNRRIAAEDQAILESSQPVAVPRPSEERSVRTDKATLQFRKYYFAELAKEQHDAEPPLTQIGHVV